MSRKRERPYNSSRHVPYSFPKRRRPLPLQSDFTTDDLDNSAPTVAAAAKQPTTVVVIGLPSDCSVLDLKSRFEIYGSISRTRMDPNGLAYITFRSHDAAQSAVSAALDPSFAITLLSKPVQVMWASDPVPQWKEGVAKNEGASSSTLPLASKLVRPEVPLSRRGRGNKLGSAIVNPRADNNGNGETNNIDNGKKVGSGDEGGSGLAKPFMGREIVAYDDIL
ncbi:hypothetical protein ACH5RR_030579 [Cinchona calisaya]|uniref:RRM domain-containing protein n=1 Tax=Cinchona calisaya TaxID=153742 RepID=A0ABD2YW68_9GENT